MKKKLLSLALAGIICTSLSIPAMATNADAAIDEDTTASMDTNVVTSEPTVTHELDAYFEWKTLRDSGVETYTDDSEQASLYEDFDLEAAVYERSQLPEDVLRAYGYSDERIQILKAYNGEEILPNSEIAVAAQASMTTYFSSGTHTTTAYQIRYVWTWDVPPLITGADNEVVGLSWSAFNSSGINFGSTIKSRAATVTYYPTSGSGPMRIDEPATEPDGHMISCTFPAQVRDQNGSYYGRTGTITVNIAPLGTAKFDSVRAQGLYVNSTAKVAVKLTISASIDVVDMQVKFKAGAGASISIEQAAKQYGKIQAIIYTNGQIVNE